MKVIRMTPLPNERSKKTVMTEVSKYTRRGVFVASAAVVLWFVSLGAIGQSSDEEFNDRMDEYVRQLKSLEVERPVEERLNRFRLFDLCSPMYLLVEDMPSVGLDIGLDKASIQAATESRLRSARLYTSDASTLSHLYINVNVVGRSFSFSLQYRKTVTDLASGLTYSATTWETGITGSHGGDGGYILSALSGEMDRFLVEFLRVNEAACE